MGSVYSYFYHEDKLIEERKEECKEERKEECKEEREPKKDSKKDSKFLQLDLNKDNQISWEEFNKVFKEKYGRECEKTELWKFLEMDKNGDAVISLREWDDHKNLNIYQNSSSWD